MWMAEVCAEGSAGDERERDGPEAEVAEEMRERECPEEKSDSVSVSEAEVVEPASESSRSEALSPAYFTSIYVKQYICAQQTYPHKPLVVIRLPLVKLLLVIR